MKEIIKFYYWLRKLRASQGERITLYPEAEKRTIIQCEGNGEDCSTCEMIEICSKEYTVAEENRLVKELIKLRIIPYALQIGIKKIIK